MNDNNGKPQSRYALGKIGFGHHKIQFAEIIFQDKTMTVQLQNFALKLGFLAIKHKTWDCYATDECLAEFMGIDSKTVSRRAKALAQTELFDVVRGKSGRATTYTISKSFARRMAELREVPDKSGRLFGSITGQLSRKNPTNDYDFTGQSCHPTRDLEGESAQNDALGLPLPAQGFEFHHTQSRHFKEWERFLRAEYGTILLDEGIFYKNRGGQTLAHLPNYLPPNHSMSFEKSVLEQILKPKQR